MLTGCTAKNHKHPPQTSFESQMVSVFQRFGSCQGRVFYSKEWTFRKVPKNESWGQGVRVGLWGLRGAFLPTGESLNKTGKV